MRLLRRNTTEFEYLPYTGTVTDLNEDNEHTGDYSSETENHYGTPVVYRGNISTPSGHSNMTFYGEDIRYTHTLVMDNPNVEINEYGRVRWKGHLYDVQAVRPSINSVSIALRRCTEDSTEGDD